MKKPLKVAAWSGIVALVLGIIISAISVTVALTFGESNFVSNLLAPLLSLVVAVFSVFFIYGFVVLAKKYDAKLLHVMAWITLAFGLISILISIFSLIFGIVASASAQSLQGSGLGSLFLIALFMWIFVAVLLGVYNVLFGIGLYKLKDKVKHAKLAGILEIVAGATYIIFIGFLIKPVANVVEIIMFFKASEKLEK